MNFRFALPKSPDGPFVEMTAAEAEKALLKRLREEKDHPTDALWRLAVFYQQEKQTEKGLSCLRQALAGMPDIETKAGCVLAMGQMMETAGDYEAAVRYYKEAFALEPASSSVWYFINNNLGFSLNTLGQFAEGERYCRSALAVDPCRPNAHKNLGIALAGQGDHRGAAESYVAATRANAADPRASLLLQNLLLEHPELEFEFQSRAAACQKVVTAVAKEKDKFKAVVYRGWKKHLLLLRMRLRSLFSRMSTRAMFRGLQKHRTENRALFKQR